MVESKTLDVTDQSGNHNHLLVMHVFPSAQVIANQSDDFFVRAGDKSKKLNFEQRMQLVDARGMKYFEDETVYGASLEDIDYTRGDAE